MKSYKREFIKFALANGVLCFGNFTLKSGRISPYFFNAGMFKDGEAFSKLSEFYADNINEHFSRDSYDILFGPAYKGIPLATAASIGLNSKFRINIPVAFNRKEIKDHGEGGNMIGAALKDNKALLIDDVVTSGTTIKDSLKIIQKEGGSLVGMAIALDRQEKGLTSEYSAIQEFENELGIKIASIITLDDLVEYLQEQDLEKNKQWASHLYNILKYRAEYGAKEMETETKTAMGK